MRPETQPSAAQSAQKSEFEALSRELFGEVAAKSRNDGYTLFIASSANITNAAGRRNRCAR